MKLEFGPGYFVIWQYCDTRAGYILLGFSENFYPHINLSIHEFDGATIFSNEGIITPSDCIDDFCTEYFIDDEPAH